jgi:hypothetical protein
MAVQTSARSILARRHVQPEANFRARNWTALRSRGLARGAFSVIHRGNTRKLQKTKRRSSRRGGRGASSWRLFARATGVCGDIGVSAPCAFCLSSRISGPAQRRDIGAELPRRKRSARRRRMRPLWRQLDGIAPWHSDPLSPSWVAHLDAIVLVDDGSPCWRVPTKAWADLVTCPHREPHTATPASWPAESPKIL